MYFQSYSNSIELNVNHTFDLIFPNISFIAISYKPSCFYKLAIGDIVSITLVIVLSLANFEITSLNLSQNISISFFLLISVILKRLDDGGVLINICKFLTAIQTKNSK